MNNDVAKMLSTCQREGRQGVILGSQKELPYRIVTVDPEIQRFVNCSLYLLERVLVQQEKYLDIFFRAVITMGLQASPIAVKTIGSGQSSRGRA